MPPYITHLFQPLAVCVFQPLNHWHSEAVNEAVQNSDKAFSKVEFLNAFNNFCSKVFKGITICSAWKMTGLIPYGPAFMIDKVCEELSPDRAITPPPEWIPLDKNLRLELGTDMDQIIFIRGYSIGKADKSNMIKVLFDPC